MPTSDTNTFDDFLAAHSELDRVISEYAQAYVMGTKAFTPLDVASKEKLLSRLQEIEQKDVDAKAAVRKEAARQEDVLRQILRRADMSVKCIDSDEFQEHKRRKETALNEQQSLYALDATEDNPSPSSVLVIPERKHKSSKAPEPVLPEEEEPERDPSLPKMVVSAKDKERMQELLAKLTSRVNEVEQLNSHGGYAGRGQSTQRRERRAECYEEIIDAREELGKVVHTTIHGILRDCNDELSRIESETLDAIGRFADDNELDELDNSEEKEAYFKTLTELLTEGLASVTSRSIGYGDAENIVARYTSSYTSADPIDSPDAPTSSELVLGYVANAANVSDDGTFANAAKSFFGQDSYADGVLVVPMAVDPVLSEHICLTYLPESKKQARSLLFNYAVQMMHFLSACGRMSVADVDGKGATLPLMSHYSDTVNEDNLNILRSKQQLNHAVHLAIARMNDNLQELREAGVPDISHYNDGKAVVQRMRSEVLVIPDISDVDSEDVLLDLKDIAQHGAPAGVYLVFGIGSDYAADNATVLTESAKAIRTFLRCSSRLFADASGNMTAGEEEQVRFIVPQPMEEKKLDDIISRFTRGDSPLAKREEESAERLRNAMLEAARIRRELAEAAANQLPPEVDRDEYDVFREEFGA